VTRQHFGYSSSDVGVIVRRHAIRHIGDMAHDDDDDDGDCGFLSENSRCSPCIRGTKTTGILPPEMLVFTAVAVTFAAVCTIVSSSDNETMRRLNDGFLSESSRCSPYIRGTRTTGILRSEMLVFRVVAVAGTFAAVCTTVSSSDNETMRRLNDGFLSESSRCSSCIRGTRTTGILPPEMLVFRAVAVVGTFAAVCTIVSSSDDETMRCLLFVAVFTIISSEDDETMRRHWFKVGPMAAEVKTELCVFLICLFQTYNVYP